MAESHVFLLGLLTATGLSALIGLELERRMQQDPQMKSFKLGGLRTFAMIGSLGFIATVLQIAPIIFAASFALVILMQLIGAYRTGIFSITVELSLLAAWLIGVLVASGQNFAAVTISILFTGLLTLRDTLHKVVKQINKEELLAIVQFLLLSAIILPLLPSTLHDPLGWFDWRPQQIWLMVILVAAIRFIGYFVAKFIGNAKSLLLSGIVGGFISSTAVTTSIAQESRGKRGILIFLVPILLANMIMFIRVILEIVIVAASSTQLLYLTALPLLVGAIVLGGLSTWWLYQPKFKTAQLKETPQVSQPLALKSALAFGIFFLLVLLLSEKIAEFLNEEWLILAGAVSGLTDVDAITLSTSNLVSEKTVNVNLGALVILVAVAVNTLVKAGIVFIFGGRGLFYFVLSSMLAAITSAGVVFWLL